MIYFRETSTVTSLPMPLKHGHSGVMNLNTPPVVMNTGDQTPNVFKAPPLPGGIEYRNSNTVGILFSKMCIRNPRWGV